MTYEEWALGLLVDGPPFVSRGRTRAGLDCWGVVWLAHKEVAGVALPSYVAEYEDTSLKNFDNLAKIYSRNLCLWRNVEGDEQPGDVVLMSVRGRPVHVGLIVAPGLMLHIEEKIELCVESYNNAGWKNRVQGIYRWCGPTG